MNKELWHFFATWCPACESMKEDLAKFEKDHPEITVKHVDLDADRETFDKYADKYMFDSMPTNIAMVDGLLHRARKGALNQDQLLALFDSRD